MHAGPLPTVAIVAGVQERHPAAARFFEVVGQLVEHGSDFRTVLFDAAGVEADIARDAGSGDILAGVLAVLEQAAHEDAADALGRKAREFRHDVLLVVWTVEVKELYQYTFM